MDYQERFYRDIFFPYLKAMDIKNIFHLGDYYDHRKNINFKALHHNRKIFLEPLVENGIHMDIIPGNHDTFYKNTNDLTSLKELLGYYTANVTIITKPTKVNGVHLIPWINDENRSEYLNYIRNNDGVLMAHLELEGFDVLKGMKSPHGMSAKYFDHYDKVLSGHFHTQSTNGTVRYLGSQMEFTWNDVDDPKWFHIYDTEDQSVTAILNPITLFEKIYYDDSKPQVFDMDNYVDKFVKVIVENKSDVLAFDALIDQLSEINTHELKIVENFQEFLGENVSTSLEDVEDTQQLMANYIESANTDLSREKLKILMNSLYNEAMDEEIV
jgi:DNA repair exonuclease SbcCD nuclease subunit